MNTFTAKIGTFNVIVNDASELLSPQEFLQNFVKDKRTIFWSDADCEHFFMDFILCKKDNLTLWCQCEHISGDFKDMTVLIEAL